jgi:hypothetical protein
MTRSILSLIASQPGVDPAFRRAVAPGPVRIVTHYDPSPIPDRSMDWSAVDDHSYGGAPGDKIGYGATEQAAIDDLREQYAEDE